ncbi:MAG: hypothetical protein AB1762_17605 [Gemmatimonadota bacterium]
MLDQLRAQLAPVFREVVERRRQRLTCRGIGPREDPLNLLTTAARLYRWRHRRERSSPAT